MKAIVKPSSLCGEISVPGSKSHTIRAVIFSALSDGRSIIKNPLESEDCLSAIRVIQDFWSRCNHQARCLGGGRFWPSSKNSRQCG